MSSVVGVGGAISQAGREIVCQFPGFFIEEENVFENSSLSHPIWETLVFEDEKILFHLGTKGIFPKVPSLSTDNFAFFEEGRKNALSQESLPFFSKEDLFVSLAKFFARETTLAGYCHHNGYLLLEEVRGNMVPEFSFLQKQLFNLIYQEECEYRKTFSVELRFLDLLARKEARKNYEKDLEECSFFSAKTSFYSDSEIAFFHKVYREKCRLSRFLVEAFDRGFF